MSPEQASGAPVDRRSDLFSLGVVLYELLAGEELFAGDSPIEVMEEVRRAQIGPPSAKKPEIPRVLDEVVAKALARNPKNRFGDARSFDRALDGAMRSSGYGPTTGDLVDWLGQVMPERSIQPVAGIGDTLAFDDTPASTARRTQPRVEPGQGFPPGPRKRWRPMVLGLSAAIVLLAIALALKVFLLPDRPTRTALEPEPPDLPVGAEIEPDVGPAPEEPPPKTVPVKMKRRPRATGTVFLDSQPWARIIIDDKDTGFTTPTVAGLRLDVGRHRVTLLNPVLELSRTFEIVVRKDEPVKRFVDLRKEGAQH